MTISDFFASISKCKCPVLTDGSALTIEDFFYDCIKPNLPEVGIVQGWHELLKTYINDPEAVFFIRRYASGKDKDNNWDIRRGFLTVYDNIKFVYVDNFFAQFFYAMAYNHFVPDYPDFKEYVLDRKIPYGYSAVSAELKHQAYKRGPSYPLNRKGWKLSHVFSANQNDYIFDYKSAAATLFPKGVYSEFRKQRGFEYPFRLMKQAVSVEDSKRITAHFLRVVHPINHFLTPMTKFQSSAMRIKDIGEYPEMLAFMKDKLEELYGSIFHEYLEMILAPKFSSYHRTLIELQYGMGLTASSCPMSVKPKVKSTPSKKTRYSATKSGPKPCSGSVLYPSNVVANCIRAYLFDGYSFRDVENEILGLEYREDGGGWIAKRLLNGRGIDASMKKIYKGKTIPDAISLAKEPLKSTLIWMNEHL